jgi:hypothetical protein
LFEVVRQHRPLTIVGNHMGRRLHLHKAFPPETEFGLLSPRHRIGRSDWRGKRALLPRDVGIWGHIGGKACGERSLVLRCCPSFPFSRHPRSTLSGRSRKTAPACPLVLIGMGRLGRKHGSRVVGRRMLLGILLIVHIPRLRAAEDRKFDRPRVLGCRTGPRILARVQPRIRRRDVEVALLLLLLGPTRRANAEDALQHLGNRGRRLGDWASSLS